MSRKSLPAPSTPPVEAPVTELLGHLLGPDVPVTPCACGGPRFVHHRTSVGRQVVCGSCGRSRWQVLWTGTWHQRESKAA